MSRDRRVAQFRGGRSVTTPVRAACVIGWPVEHSRSPLIHNYWLKRYGIAGEYRRELVPRGRVRRLRRIARRTRLCRRQCDLAAQGSGAGAVGARRARARGRRRQHAVARRRRAALDQHRRRGVFGQSRRLRAALGRKPAKRWCSAPAAPRAPSSMVCSRAGSSGSFVVNRTPAAPKHCAKHSARACSWQAGMSWRRARRCGAPRQHHDARHAGTARSHRSIWRRFPVTPSSPTSSMCRC